MQYDFEAQIRHARLLVEMYQDEWHFMLKVNDEVHLRNEFRELVDTLKSYGVEAPTHYPDKLPIGSIHNDVRSLITVVDGGLA